MEVGIALSPTIPDPVSVAVVEATQVGEARRAAVALAEALDFDEQQAGEVAIAATEAATNLARHAQGGEVVIRSVHAGPAAWVELIAIDRGPGMANMVDALRDGYSTGTTPGTGLGAIRRLSATFDAYTHAPSGTVLLSRLGPSGATAPAVGVVCLPKRGEVANGDAWAVEDAGGGRTLVLVADGLGHGLQAAEASRRAVRLFRDNLTLDTPGIVDALHAGLRATRGAAVAVAELRRGQSQVRFTGLGNIAASIVTDGKSRSMVSQNGTAGVVAHRVQEFTYPWDETSLLVMHSDGLSGQWQLDRYPGLRSRCPAVIAGVLYRDFRRERDDVTVLVLPWDKGCQP